MSDLIVVVEDDRQLREMLLDLLRESGYRAAGFARGDAALRAMQEGTNADLVLTDLMLPGLPGQELLREIRRGWPDVPVVIITAFGSIDSAIELVKAGAFDYLTKPLRTNELLVAIERALGATSIRRDVAREARSELTGVPSGFVGASPVMQQLYQVITKVATSPHAVLVTGETGTGKELAARAVHRLSGRDAFVIVNCGALPEALLESELFGHERGAFTGADRTKEGLFHVADRGTLFLDEIAELPITLQPKLLRALEQSEIRRVGSTQTRTVNVRVIAATNRNLEAEVEGGRFRADLYWRLNVLTVDVPPLRERGTDIPRLAEYFLARAVDEGKLLPNQDAEAAGTSSPPMSISKEAMAFLMTYPWPGNVRELRNAILRVATLAPGPVIAPDDLPPRIREAQSAGSVIAAAMRRRLTVGEIERLYVLEVLRETAGNKSRAADILGFDRRTLHRKLQEYKAEEPISDW